MNFFENIVLIFFLIGTSCFFSMSEIALAASRKMKLQQLADEGNHRAKKVLQLQASPGNFFTIVQIGLNGVAIMGGIVGESAFTPFFHSMLQNVVPSDWLTQTSFVLSFALVTSLFILIADLIPKRIAMIVPESVAMTFVVPILFCITLLKPLVWFFNALANLIIKVLRIPSARNDEITNEDIYAVMDAGAAAGLLHQGEHEMMESVFEMKTVCVTYAMTPRETLVYFLLSDNEADIKRKITETPHSNFLVCDESLDNIKGYVNSKQLLIRAINDQEISVTDEKLVKNCPILPDTLNLFEAMEYFKTNRVDFAVVMNEYALVLGIVTVDDLQSAVTGTWVMDESEEQIVARGENSWLIDGVTPIADVMRALNIESFPHIQNYETIAGFMMFMLRKFPKRCDFVNYSGYKFEVVDIDDYKVDQLLVTKIIDSQTVIHDLPLEMESGTEKAEK